jgi:hypothetical protein
MSESPYRILAPEIPGRLTRDLVGPGHRLGVRGGQAEALGPEIHPVDVLSHMPRRVSN